MENLIKRFKRIRYTWKHKTTFLKIEKQLRGYNTLRGYLHDSDKLFLYLCLWMSSEKIQQIHRHHQRHHINDKPKSREDYIEMIIDWESARFTKKDKPLNAYDTMLKFYPQLEKDVLPLMKELNLLK